MLGPIPRWFLWCTRPFLPRGHRPSPCRDRLGSPQQSVQRLPYGRFHGAAVVRLCSGLRVCSPPRSLPPQYPMALGSRGLYVRAYDGSLPPRPSDMLAVRIGQLTAWGLPPHKIRGLAARSPDVISACLSLDAWTLTPAAWWCTYHYFPTTIGLPPVLMGRLPASIRSATSEREVMSGLQSPTHVQASRFAATQVLLPPCHNARGSRGVYVRAAHQSLPSGASDMLAVRMGN